jgi:hypothetical protein
LDAHPRPTADEGPRRLFPLPDLWEPEVDVLQVVSLTPEAAPPLLVLTLQTLDRYLGRLLRSRRETPRARAHAALVAQGSTPDLDGLWSWAAAQLDEGSLDSDCGGVLRLYANLLSKTIAAPADGAPPLGAWALLVGRVAGLDGMPDGSLYDAFHTRAYEAWVQELLEQRGVRFDRAAPPPPLPRGPHAHREAFELPGWADAFEMTRRLDLVDKDFRDADPAAREDLLLQWLQRAVRLWKALPEAWELLPAVGPLEERLEILEDEGLSDDALEDLWAWFVRASREHGRPEDAVIVLQLGANTVLRILEKSCYDFGGFDGGLLELLAWLSRLSGAAAAGQIEGAIDAELADRLAAEASRLR